MRLLFTTAAIAALIACTPAAKPAATPEPVAAAAVALVASNQAAGTAALETGDEVAYAAGVTAVHDLKQDGAKIFTTAGGDPAINGLYTYLAVFNDEERGWQSYQIGDFNEMAIVSEIGDQVGLKVSKSHIKDDGNVATEDLYLLVTIPKPGAKEITIAPAEVKK